MLFVIDATNQIKNNQDFIHFVPLEIQKFMYVLVVAIYVIFVNQIQKIKQNSIQTFVILVKNVIMFYIVELLHNKNKTIYSFNNNGFFL